MKLITGTVPVSTRSLKMVGAIIHNDAGSKTPEQYKNWLLGMSSEQLEDGFAHWYINRNERYLAMPLERCAWHCGNAWGNANLGSYEVCQSLSATDEEFLANEEAVFAQVAEDFKYRGLPANRDTIKLHCEYFATACPQRSLALHGGNVESCRSYFIERVNAHMNGDAEQSVPQPVEPIKPKLEAVVPVGGIGVGTNVHATVPSLTSSRSPNSAFWVSNYIEGALSPYELTRDGKVAAYTTRDYIQRVNKLPVGVIPDGSNVIVNKLSDSCDKAPDKSTGYQTFWIAQYVDGNKKSAYRLVKNGITVGYTNRDNIQVVK
ncbi:N-acetylmuramoyl-L-alanine amidase [Carnobacterium maltaromaticum]|uniref:peptidoglycan recognition protein family protein n=1 Tax=Carnobacterium maltaromaticum TaxID=2751 RepID=UPI0039BDF1F2